MFTVCIWLLSWHTFVILHIELSYTQDLRRQRQAIQIALKEIELLSFNMEVIENLQNLAKTLQCKYCECVPKYPGLVLRPKATSSAERAFQLKQKYKRLSEQVSQYKALPTKQGRRPQLDASYCNRVEWKATNKCKVESIYQYVQVSAPMHDTNNIGKQPLRVPVFCTAKNSMTLCVKHLIGTKAVVQTTTKLCSHSCVAFKFSRPG